MITPNSSPTHSFSKLAGHPTQSLPNLAGRQIFVIVLPWFEPRPALNFFHPLFFSQFASARLINFSPKLIFHLALDCAGWIIFYQFNFDFFHLIKFRLFDIIHRNPQPKNSNLTYTPTTEVFFAYFRCMDLANFEIRVRKISNLLYHETWKVSSIADFFGLSNLHVLFTKKNSSKNYW